MSTLHIRAVGDLRCPFVGADGVPVPGRYAGRARKTFEALPDGEHIPDTSDHRRAIVRGDLALVAPKPIDIPLAIDPMPVIDLGERLPVIDLGFNTKPASKEHDQ